MNNDLLINLIKNAPMPCINEFKDIAQIDFLIKYDNYITDIINLYEIINSTNQEYLLHINKLLLHLIVRLTIILYHNIAMSKQEKNCTFNILNTSLEDIYKKWNAPNKNPIKIEYAIV